MGRFFGTRKWGAPPFKSPGDDEAEHELLTGEKAHKQQIRSSTMKICLLTITNLTTLGLSAYLLFKNYVEPSLIPTDKNAILKQCSYWCESSIRLNEDILMYLIAPVLEEIELPAYVSKMNGTFFPLENPSFGRQEPSWEVSEMWQKLSPARGIVISKDDVIRLGKDPATAARYDDEYVSPYSGAFDRPAADAFQVGIWRRRVHRTT